MVLLLFCKFLGLEFYFLNKRKTSQEYLRSSTVFNVLIYLIYVWIIVWLIYEISFKSQVKKYLNLILSFLDWFEKILSRKLRILVNR